MKKIICIILLLSMTISLCGCTQGGVSKKFLLKTINTLEEIPNGAFLEEDAIIQEEKINENADTKNIIVKYSARNDICHYSADIELIFAKKKELIDYNIKEITIIPCYKPDEQKILDEIATRYGKNINKIYSDEKISDLEYKYICKTNEAEGEYLKLDYTYEICTVFNPVNGWEISEIKETQRNNWEKLRGKWLLKYDDEVFLMDIYNWNYESIAISYEYRKGKFMVSSRVNCKLNSVEGNSKYENRPDVKNYIDFEYITKWSSDVFVEHGKTILPIDISCNGIFESNDNKIVAAERVSDFYHLEIPEGTIGHVEIK